MIDDWFYHLNQPCQYTSILEYAKNKDNINILDLLTQFHQEWVLKLDNCKDNSNSESILLDAEYWNNLMVSYCSIL